MSTAYNSNHAHFWGMPLVSIFYTGLFHYLGHSGIPPSANSNQL